MTEKLCRACGEVKPLEDFSPRGKYWSSKCKPCAAEWARAYRQEHGDITRETQRKSHQKHRSERLQWMADYQRSMDVDERRAYHRGVYHGVVSQIRELLGPCYCGLSERTEIHHVNLDGEEHRRTTTVATYYRQILESVKSGEDKYVMLCKKHHVIAHSGGGCAEDTDDNDDD